MPCPGAQTCEKARKPRGKQLLSRVPHRTLFLQACFAAQMQEKSVAARYERCFLRGCFALRNLPRGKFLHCPKNSGASRPAHSLKIKDKTQHILLGSRGFRAGRLLTGFSSPHAPFAYAFALYVRKMPSQPLLSESRQLRHVAEALRYAALSRHIAKQNRHRTQRAQTTRKPIM